MPTVAIRTARPAISFLLSLAVWSLALFGVLRLNWVAAHVVLTSTRWQAAAGAALFGPGRLPIEATLACSGADALALCLAAIAAYPATWLARAQGMAAASVFLFGLNAIRIGSLGRAVSSPFWFRALHLYVWPMLLTVALAGFVFGWMRIADRPLQARQGPGQFEIRVNAWRAARVFALTTIGALIAFTLASPLYLESARVAALAGLVAHGAAFILRGLGMPATATTGLLITPHGAFQVTQECIVTPLIPVYGAAVLVYARGWRTKAIWFAAAVPIFLALGTARLLVVVLPQSIVASPAFAIHSFSQVFVAAGLVGALGAWRHGIRLSTLIRVAVALLAATVVIWLCGTTYGAAISRAAGAPDGLADPQSARMFLPSFQLGFLLALWIAAVAGAGWRPLAGSVVALAITQVCVVFLIQRSAAHGWLLSVPMVRAWALLGPLILIGIVVHAHPQRR